VYGVCNGEDGGERVGSGETKNRDVCCKKQSRKLVKCRVPTSCNSCRSDEGASKNGHLERRIGSSTSLEMPTYIRIFVSWFIHPGYFQLRVLYTRIVYM
jgi:hypothetical protein